ncbi:sigma-54-dependent transcriptional regulator [Desulfolithobacter sp.]
MTDIHILVVDDDLVNRDNIAHVLEKEGYFVQKASSGEEALQKLQIHRFDLVITDMKMAEVDGLQVMNAVKDIAPDAEVIIITGYATVHSAVEAMNKGAFYYLPKPFNIDKLRGLVSRALEKTLLRREVLNLRRQITAKEGVTQFIGQNHAILRLKDDIAQVAQMDCNVLITGDTGTGKELVARTIYELSPRANNRFLPINCGALTEELMLNELFGHEKEAFTGASKWRKGLLESANGGVVLFDEIGEMPMTMQVKLLRVLQERKIIRVGGTREIPVDIRILAATNRNLQEEAMAGRFRQDLFYRLNVVSLHIPPLRERKDDIPLLVHHFLAKYPGPDDHIKSISPEAMAALQDHDYPGNVRELENIIERSLAMCNEAEIKIYHLPREISSPGAITVTPIHSCQTSVPACTKTVPSQTLEENERRYILEVLRSVDGNKTRAAAILGIDRVSLWRKLKKYQNQGIDVDNATGQKKKVKDG